jgi:hypothetical protein
MPPTRVLQDALAEERAHMESLQAQQEQIEQLRKCHPWVNVGTVVVFWFICLLNTAFLIGLVKCTPCTRVVHVILR